VTYHPHNVDTETFSRDAVAGTSAECIMNWRRSPLAGFAVFQFSAGSSVISKVARLLRGMKGIHVTYDLHNVNTKTFSRDGMAGIRV